MNQHGTYTPEYPAQFIPCPVCNGPLAVRLAHGRRSNKPFVMLICERDGRHIRAFINDRQYVGRILDQLEGLDEVSNTHLRAGPASRVSL